MHLRSNLFVTCLLFNYFLPSVYSQTVAQSLIGIYTVDTSISNPTAPICASTCCCFTNQVNAYYNSADGEIYLNGTVSGKECDGPVKQDNLDPPAAYTFSQEFFGIDIFSFTLRNSIEGTNSGVSLLAKSSSRPECSFSLFRSTNSPLPVTPDPNPTVPPLPPFDQIYIGNWQWDSNTCASSNPACCCLTQTGRIYQDPNGAESFFVTGIPSSGCDTSTTGPLEDDFPWPLTGTTSKSQISVQGFLPNQDNYNITLTQTASGYSIFFSDIDNPACSMLGTKAVGSSSSMFKNNAGWYLFVSSSFLLLILFPNYLY